MSEIERLRAEIEYVRAHLEAIDAEAGDEAIEGERAEQFDAGVAFVEEHTPKLADLEAREARRADLRSQVESGKAAVVPTTPEFHINTRASEDPYDLTSVDRGRYDAEVIGRAKTAIESGDGWIRDEHREQATRRVEQLGNSNRASEQILLAASPAYRSAFAKSVRQAEAPGSTESYTDEERFRMTEVDHIVRQSGFWQPVNDSEARALALTNVTGKLVPSQLDTSVILTNDGALNPFRAISRVIPVSTNVWTGVSSAGITAGWTGAEGSEVDDAPSFSNPSVTCYMADAFVPISFQAYEDWGAGESELERMLNDAKARLEATAFATGSGSNQPTGVVTALDANTNVEVSMATNSAYAIADLYTLKQALPDRWKPNASFVSAEEYIDRTRQFATANNYHAFLVDLSAGDIPQVLGKRWYESSAMSGALNTATNNAIVFGDFSQYVIADRIGMVVEFVPNLFSTTTNRPSGQRGWLAHWRVGADSIVDTAFRLLQNPA